VFCTETTSKYSISKILEDLINKDQLYRSKIQENNITGILADSLSKLQDKIDEKNTKQLIAIMQSKCFKKHNINDSVPYFLIFVHSPPEYKDQIIPILNKELKKGEIQTLQYDFVMWHLNGRKGAPFKIKVID